MSKLTPSDASPLHIDTATQDLLFRSARTPKAFLSDPVDDSVLAAVADLVRWGPTMTNAQPLRVVLARSPEARARVIEHLLPYNRERAANAPTLAVFCADLVFDRLGGEIFPNPGMAALYADDAFRERVADSQAWLQAGYWIQGIRAAGLDVLPMMGFDNAGLDAMLEQSHEALFPGADLRSIMVAAIGHADPSSYPPAARRLSVDETVVELPDANRLS